MHWMFVHERDIVFVFACWVAVIKIIKCFVILMHLAITHIQYSLSDWKGGTFEFSFITISYVVTILSFIMQRPLYRVNPVGVAQG